MASYQLDDGDLVQTNLNMSMNGQRLMNTFHWRFEKTASGPLDGPTVLAALNDLLASDSTWYLQNIRPAVHTSLLFDNLTSQKIRPSRWRSVKKTLALAGTSTGVPAPQNAAVSMSRWGLLAYRGAQGRIQVPGAVMADITDGKLNASGVSDFGTPSVTLAFAETVTGAGRFVPVLAKLVESTGYSFNEITGTDLQTTIRVMRRRTVGVGK